MASQLTYTRDPEDLSYALGRNGFTFVTGLLVEEGVYDCVHLYPMNTKGQTTRCRIPIPLEAIPALIEELKKYA